MNPLPSKPLPQRICRAGRTARALAFQAAVTLTLLVAGCSGGASPSEPPPTKGADSVVRCARAVPWASRVFSDGPLNTNYRAGEGFAPGRGRDPAPQDPFEITDARVKRFPNSRTDIVTFDCAAAEIGRVVQAVDLNFPSGQVLRFLAPDAQLTEKIERGTDSVQFIVNQHFEHDGHDLLVTWVLPPRFDPRQPHAALIFVPGQSHTTLTRLLADPDLRFLRTGLSAMAQAPRNDVVMAVINMGGRTSIGLQPGFEDVVADAVAWGAAQLGIDRQRLVFNGPSRGGYGAMILAGRLAARSELRVRAVFASVFGTGGELWAMPELAPTDLPERLVLGFAEHQQRIAASDDLAVVEGVRGPLGAAAQLAAAARSKGDVLVYLAHGSADPTHLPSAAVRVYDTLAAEPAVKVWSDMLLGEGHDAGDAQRDRSAAEITARIAADRAVGAWQTRQCFIDGMQRSTTAPLHLRGPARAAEFLTSGVARALEFDLFGEPGQPWEVRLLDAQGGERGRISGTLQQRTARLSVPMPSPGTYAVELHSAGRSTLAPQPLTVVAGLLDPVAITRESSLWRPVLMPVQWLPGQLRGTADCNDYASTAALTSAENRAQLTHPTH